MKAIVLILLLLGPLARAASLPTISDEETLAKLRSHLSGGHDAFQREIRRLPNKTIEMEVFVSADMDPNMAPAILSDYRHYAGWMMNDINRPPAGGSYLCQLRGLSIDPIASNLLVAIYSLDVPLLHTERTVTFEMDSRRQARSFTLTARTDEPSGALASAAAVLKLYPAQGDPSRSWIYVRGTVQLRSWILFEALPEKVLSHETGDRIRILVDNYLREESTRRAMAEQARARTRPRGRLPHS